MPGRRVIGVVVALVAGAITAAPALADPSATIRRTAHGIPHILAQDYEGAGYGYGYAIAQDNICVLADTYLTVEAQRSRYLGPDATYQSRGNGATFKNIDSDFFFQRALDTHVVDKLLADAPPKGPIPDVRSAVKGYVEGYNRYLADTGVDNIPDPTCRGKPWVQPITELDAYMRFWQLGILASQGVAIDGIAQAAPPTPAFEPPVASAARQDEMLREIPKRLHAIGSNAIGLGGQSTDNGKGMVLANPHFPWDGPERFYESQITIPGKVNVFGASLFGVPAVLIGHTDHMAWSHTVSTAFRFTPFELKLVPGAPTQYLYDGGIRTMTSDKVTVQAKQADGSLKPQTRTLYSTIQGPVLTSILGLPLFPWTPERAYAMGDANAGNFRYLNHFFATDRAQSVSELDAIERRYQGIPWVNTIAADSTGKAYYADIGTIPNVSDAKSAQCANGALAVAAKALIGLPVLDGSRSACAWDNDPDAVAPGTFGPSHEPSLFRDDYVTNSNDSYWLSNPKHPLEGFARIIGDERTARTLRTRLGLKMVQQYAPFSTRSLQDAEFNDRQHAGELWKDDLVAMCEAHPVLAGTSGPVDVSAACPVLKAWDQHDNLDSKGAILFRRFAENALGVTGVSPFSVPFDANDPVNTPRGLDTNNPVVQRALADAVGELNSKHIPLDATLRNYQYVVRDGEKIPIHGGPGDPDGVFNAINVSNLTSQGYTNVPHGSSFVMVTHFTNGCPENRAILTYSQSTDPTSPYHADQTRLFSNKEWVDPPFCEKDIVADPSLKVTQLGSSGARSAGGAGCLPARRRLSSGTGLGAVRMNATRASLTKRAGAATRRTSKTMTWCVRGGGTVTAVIARGRSVLVASTVRGARAGSLRVGARARGTGLRRRGRVVYRVRRGRIVLVGVTRTVRRARAYGRLV
jgi:acyl-homoserine-lactone acylase